MVTQSDNESYKVKALIGLAILEATIQNDEQMLRSFEEEFSRGDITSALVAAGFCLAAVPEEGSRKAQMLSKLQEVRQQLLLAN